MVTFVMRRMNKNALTVLSYVFLYGCISSQPNDIDNICSMFEEKRNWYSSAQSAEKRWGIPIAVNMAVIYQESSFKARARPNRSKFLWVLPGRRPSSAYGYAQALDSTWNDYKKFSGNKNASRNNFSDAIDFVGWYNSNSRRINSIDYFDAKNFYLAYHEGNSGFARQSYKEKQWLINAANRVQRNSEIFSSQLKNCENELSKGWLWRLLS